MTDPVPPLRAAIVPVTPLQQNCTLLWCTKTMRGAFVDPLGAPGAAPRGLSELNTAIAVCRTAEPGFMLPLRLA